MGINVALSQRSLALLLEYSQLVENDTSLVASPSGFIDSESLVEWLYGVIQTPKHGNQKDKHKEELLLSGLRTQLLHDLFLAMKGEPLLVDADLDVKTNETNKRTYIFLSIAGTLFAACEGFDSIATILGVVSASSTIILPIALVFSILSIIAFHAFELVQVAKNLGVNVSDASKLLHEYWSQMNQVKAIRQKIDTYCLATLSCDELVHLEATLSMLQKRFQALKEAGNQFNKALNSPGVQITKAICSALTGIFFFGGGFCAGQTVGTFFCGLIFTSVTPAFWPVLVISILVGLAALSLYYYVERLTVNRLISGWFGLDEDEIEVLCDAKELAKEERRLLILEEKVRSTVDLVRRVEAQGSEMSSVVSTVGKDKALSEDIQVSANIYSFHRVPNLRLEVPEQLEENAFEPASP